MSGRTAIPVRKINSHKLNEPTKITSKAFVEVKNVNPSHNGEQAKLVNRRRNTSGQQNKVVSSVGPVKSYAERKRELKKLEDEIASLKEQLTESELKTCTLQEQTSKQNNHLVELEEHTEELSSRLRTTEEKLKSCEHDLELLGYDPVTRTKISEKENAEISKISESVVTASKLKEDLLIFKDRNIEIISNLQEILETMESQEKCRNQENAFAFKV